MNPSTLLLAEIATVINLGAILVNLGIHIATTRQNRDRLEKLEAAVNRMLDTVVSHAERIARVEEKIEGMVNGKFQGKHPEDHPRRDRRQD